MRGTPIVAAAVATLTTAVWWGLSRRAHRPRTGREHG